MTADSPLGGRAAAEAPLPGRADLTRVRVAVVVPVFNEAGVLTALIDRTRAALATSGGPFELVFVDDGSTDSTGAILDGEAAADSRIRVLHLSRNFGHQSALQAGLTHARGDVVVVMDGDLQDDPASIPALLARWQVGYDVVYAIRTKRKESVLKRAAFAGFYRVLGAISQVAMPLDAGNFGLIDARVAREIARLTDRDRYFAGLRSWVGFRSTGVVVERGARYDTAPRVSLRGLWLLAKTAIFSFSSLPLTVFYFIAFGSFAVFAAAAAFTVYHKVVTGLAIPGWTSTILIASFFGAINALGIGIVGEYVLRIYDQVRARPSFLIARSVNDPPPGDDPASDQSPKNAASSGSAR